MSNDAPEPELCRCGQTVGSQPAKCWWCDSSFRDDCRTMMADRICVVHSARVAAKQLAHLLEESGFL